MKPLGSIVLVLGLAGAAGAGETAWQDVSPDVHMRLVTGDALGADGTTWAALEIDMPADTKTYWRVPGESGIPPRFDLSASRGVSGMEIAWPYPRRETDKGYLDHVYYGHFVLPFALTVAGENPVLEAEVTLGICSDICVPVTARFVHAFDFSAPDRGHDLRIRQALARVPLPWDGETDPLGAARFDAETGTVSVALADAGFPAESLIADVAGKPVLFGPPRPAAEGDALVLPVLGRQTALDGARLHLTFMTARGPYEIVRVIGAP